MAKPERAIWPWTSIGMKVTDNKEEQRLYKKGRMRTTAEAKPEEEGSPCDIPGGIMAKGFLKNDVKYQVLNYGPAI